MHHYKTSTFITEAILYHRYYYVYPHFTDEEKEKKSTEKVCSLYDYIDIHVVLNNALIFKRNQIALMLNPKGNQSNRLIHVKR